MHRRLDGYDHPESREGFVAARPEDPPLCRRGRTDAREIGAFGDTRETIDNFPSVGPRFQQSYHRRRLL